MPGTDQSQLTQIVVVGGILLANAGAIVASFVALKVAVAKLEVKVEMKTESLEKDINNLGALYRNKQNS